MDNRRKWLRLPGMMLIYMSIGLLLAEGIRQLKMATVVYTELGETVMGIWIYFICILMSALCAIHHSFKDSEDFRIADSTEE